MRKLLAVLFCASMLVIGGGCRTLALPVTSVAPGGLTANKVRKAIIDAATGLGWTVTSAGESVLEAKSPVKSTGHGNYCLFVDIAYTATGYTIKYKDSGGMGYNEKSQTIGGKGGQWLSNLDFRIQRELARMSLYTTD